MTLQAHSLMGDVVFWVHSALGMGRHLGPQGWSKDSWILRVLLVLEWHSWKLKDQRAGHLDTRIPEEQGNTNLDTIV